MIFGLPRPERQRTGKAIALISTNYYFIFGHRLKGFSLIIYSHKQKKILLICEICGKKKDSFLREKKLVQIRVIRGKPSKKKPALPRKGAGFLTTKLKPIFKVLSLFYKL